VPEYNDADYFFISVAGNAEIMLPIAPTGSPTPVPPGYVSTMVEIRAVETKIVFPVKPTDLEGDGGYALTQALQTGFGLAIGFITTDQNVKIVAFSDGNSDSGGMRQLSSTEATNTSVTFEVTSNDEDPGSLLTSLAKLQNNILVAGLSGAIIAKVQAQAMKYGVLTKDLQEMERKINPEVVQTKKMVERFVAPGPIEQPKSKITWWAALIIIVVALALVIKGWMIAVKIFFKSTENQNSVKPNAVKSKDAVVANQVLPSGAAALAKGPSSKNVVAPSTPVQKFVGNSVADFEIEDAEEEKEDAEPVKEAKGPPIPSNGAKLGGAAVLAVSGSIHSVNALKSRLAARRSHAALIIQRAWRDTRWHFRVERLLEQRRKDPKQTEFCKRIIRAMVAKHAPEKLKNMDELFTLYKGLDDLRSLVRRVAGKYGLDGEKLLHAQDLESLGKFLDAQSTLEVVSVSSPAKGPPVPSRIHRAARMPTIKDLTKVNTTAASPEKSALVKKGTGQSAMKPSTGEATLVKKGTGQSAMQSLRRSSSNLASSIMAQMKAHGGPPTKVGPSRPTSTVGRPISTGPSKQDLGLGATTKISVQPVDNANIDDEYEKFKASFIKKGAGELDEQEYIQADAAANGIQVDSVQDAAVNFIQTRVRLHQIRKGLGHRSPKHSETRKGEAPTATHYKENGWTDKMDKGQHAAKAMQTVWRLHLWRERARESAHLHKDMNEMLQTSQMLRSNTYKKDIQGVKSKFK